MINYAVGIDYSMTCPSICVHNGLKNWSLSNCKFYFLTNKKSCIINNQIFNSDFHLDFSTQEERFNNISDWAISVIPKYSIVGLEDYAFAATGVVFNIGECTGLLKHKLWKNNYNFKTYAPSQIKKFATTKGNANKMMMYENFVSETEFDISSIIHCKEGDSPMSDIIDSYYIAKLAFSNTLPK